jgi:hypothetical protein
MNPARVKLFLVALATSVVLAIAPSSAMAIDPGDVLPPPTVQGLPAVTAVASAHVTLSSTVAKTWFVDFGCGFDSPLIKDCGYTQPSCTVAGEQHTCTETAQRTLTPGAHTFFFAAAYCDEPNFSDCDVYDQWYASDPVTVKFVVDRIPPIVTITSGPGLASQVTKPGGGTFVFTANEAVTFSCQIDSDDELPCSSPYVLPKYLKNGRHILTVTANDAAGNGFQATRTFRVDVFHAKKCKKKGSSKSAKAKYKKCKAKNVADKKAWKKKHNLH